MKNPAKAYKEISYSIIGDSLTVSGSSVINYTDPPQKPSANYIWIDITNSFDIGDKGSFLIELAVEYIIVTKKQPTNNSSLLLEQISEALTELVIQRGYNTTSGDFKLISVTLEGSSYGESEIGNVTEMFKRVKCRVIMEEL